MANDVAAWFRRPFRRPVILLRHLAAGFVLSAGGQALASGQDAIESVTEADGEDAADARQGPIALDVVYTFDGWVNANGGADTGSRYLDNLDVTLEADLQRLVGWNGATFFAYGLYNNGNSISELLGDGQVVSSIETGFRAARLYELWLDQRLGEITSIRIGLYDLNSEFDALEASALFVGSPHGIGTDIAQSGDAGPSIFPVTSLAIRFDVAPSENLTFRGALLDGVPGNPDRPQQTAVRLRAEDGVLFIGEADARISVARLLFGHWRYTSDFETWSGGTERGNSGWYLRGEGRVFSESSDQSQGLDAFFRLGTASGKFNQFDTFLSSGVTYAGPISGRDSDQFGIAFATAFTSDDLARARPSDD